MPVGQKRGAVTALAAALLLTACGSTPLSSREIVRAAFFGKGSVLLLLADEQAADGGSSCKTAQGQGATPAQALQSAAASLEGTAFYGLMDAVGLPPGCDWQTAAEIGELLYDEGKPAPELSVFLLQAEETPRAAAQDYAGMQALRESCGIHCGLQALFIQSDVCAVPIWQAEGYGFALLPKGGEPIYFTAVPTAQLAAVLCGQAGRLEFAFVGGTAHCAADAEATVLPQGNATAVQLHLRHLELDSLSDTLTRQAAAACLRSELLAAFDSIARAAQEQSIDPLRLGFWTAVKYGPGTRPAAPYLQVLLE